MNNYTGVWVLLIYFGIWFFVLGLCVGSFLNVVALRGLSGESIVLPPSKCPKCNNKLKWWMNIPVFSYIFLRGKCWYCKEHISIQYPVVELFCGFLFLFLFLKFGFSLQTLFFMIACSILTVMSVCDFKESVIIDFHAYILIFTGILYQLISNGIQGAVFALIGAAIGFLLYEILVRIVYFFIGQRIFGEGDSLISAGIGAFFGWKMVFISAIISALIMVTAILPYYCIHAWRIKKVRTLRALFCAGLLLAFIFCFAKSEIIEQFYALIIFLIVVIFAAIWCIREILSEVKTDEPENLCFMPYGPAMAVSFLLILFFKPQIISLVTAYLNTLL
ncbi:MAG: prepilin peptidase [Candidatus Gastranaerophilales bacterium]|nr:prepilin peptidase [Candidatus Gastranaerophilales bacterium]